ncbi:MAG: nucleotidyltransferase domain-containing protein [Spirochaetes bacterium]|nr:nucleotidyltransferase domain-containing protein [Spirochaetota bacterium]
MTQDKKTLLSKITKIIINASHPSKIILFGSQANDNQNPDSDYDILIIKDNIENERKITRVIYRSLYEHKISVPVDLIAVDSKKWELNKSNKYMIYYQAAEKGIVLYE